MDEKILLRESERNTLRDYNRQQMTFSVQGLSRVGCKLNREACPLIEDCLILNLASGPIPSAWLTLLCLL